jgi:NADH:ubiquinone oxidoreductase subunit K
MSSWAIGELIFFVGLIRFLLNQNHYLSMLLRLELVILSIYCLYCNYISWLGMGGEMVFLFLTIIICEGAFGLRVLVYFSRGYGCDINYFLIKLN